ncbi:MAG: alpha/beta hydrolase [Polyangiaceae bacterium]
MRLTQGEKLKIALARRTLRQLVSNPTTRKLLARHRGRRAALIEPELAALLRLDDLTGDSVFTGCTPEEARRKLRLSVAVADAPPPADVSILPLEIPVEAGSLAARQYHARGVPEGAPGVVYLHGGGFVTGDLDTHEGLCARISAFARVRVVSVAYRLAPEHPFPAAPEDAVQAFRWVAEHADSLAMDPKRLVVMGDSAGGNLSAVVARKTRDDAIPPALQVLLYPATDLTRTLPSHQTLREGWFLTRELIDWFYEHYVAGRRDVDRDPDASPLHAPDLSRVCSALIYVAGLDPLRDEGLAYAERLRAAGGAVQVRDFPRLVHGFAMMTAASPGCADALVRVTRDMAEALSTLKT